MQLMSALEAMSGQSHFGGKPLSGMRRRPGDHVYRIGGGQRTDELYAQPAVEPHDTVSERVGQEAASEETGHEAGGRAGPEEAIC